MSRGFCWLAGVVLCITFFRGLLAFAESTPVIALVIAGIVVYALIAIAREAAES